MTTVRLEPTALRSRVKQVSLPLSHCAPVPWPHEEETQNTDSHTTADSKSTFDVKQPALFLSEMITKFRKGTKNYTTTEVTRGGGVEGA